MKRGIRKELTNVWFSGVSKEGNLIFIAGVSYYVPDFKFCLTAYSEGKAEVAIDYQIEIPIVAQFAAGLFSKESRFNNLEELTLNYRNISLKIGKDTGRKNIFTMIMKAVATAQYKLADNNVVVDTRDCRIDDVMFYNSVFGTVSSRILFGCKNHLTSFLFDGIVQDGKEICFREFWTEESLIVSSLKDGVITVKCVEEGSISDFIKQLRDIFTPFCNMYGIKAVEAEFNDFSIRVDETNSDRIFELYNRSLDISNIWT